MSELSRGISTTWTRSANTFSAVLMTSSNLRPSPRIRALFLYLTLVHLVFFPKFYKTPPCGLFAFWRCKQSSVRLGETPVWISFTLESVGDGMSGKKPWYLYLARCLGGDCYFSFGFQYLSTFMLGLYYWAFLNLYYLRILTSLLGFQYLWTGMLGLPLSDFLNCSLQVEE